MQAVFIDKIFISELYQFESDDPILARRNVEH